MLNSSMKNVVEGFGNLCIVCVTGTIWKHQEKVVSTLELEYLDKQHMCVILKENSLKKVNVVLVGLKSLDDDIEKDKIRNHVKKHVQ